MPIYEYRCSACGRRFTQYSRRIVASDEEQECPPCPDCLSHETTRQLGSFMIQGAKPVDPKEIGYQNEQQEREAQITPREQIEAFRKMTTPESQ